MLTMTKRNHKTVSGYIKMSTDAIVALLGAGLLAVVGHGMAMWYRMGKIEGKIEVLCLRILGEQRRVRDEENRK